MKKNKLTVVVSITFLLVALPFIGRASLAPTEQAQEQGVSGMRPEGFSQSQADATAGVDERGLVPCTLTECTFCDLLKLIERIFYWLLALAFALAVFFVIVSGFAYILSVGDSSMMGWAKEGLKLSLIGFAICLLAWLAIHVLYTVLGYKGNWWTMECASDQQATSTRNSTLANLYASEVTPDNLGGRNNPINLINLTTTDLKQLPENKYFFIHGIGGQPLDRAAEQLAVLTKSAAESKKIIYAAVPSLDNNGDIIGTRLVGLNELLSPETISNLLPDNIPEETKKEIADTVESVDKKTKDRFYDLILSMLLKSVSQEIPLIASSDTTQIPDFNSIWPEANWTGLEGDGAAPAFQPLKKIISGLKYEEGNGPFFYDPERYDGKIPENQTHVQVNLNPDGSLNADKPISVLNVAKGVSKSEMEDYLRQVLSILFSLDKQNKDTGTKGDIIYQLTDLLSRSVTEKVNKLNASQNKNNLSSKSKSANKNSNAANQLGNNNYNNANTNTNSYINTNTNSQQPTGGSGILPNQLQQNGSNQKISDKQLADLIKKLTDQQKQEGGSTGGGSGRSGNGGGNTGGTNNGGNNGNNNGSDTSISSSGYTLDTEEKKQLEKMVEEDLAEMKLNVPKEFVLCIVQRESAFKPEALNSSGEYSVGLMQINKRSKTDVTALNDLKQYGGKEYQELLKVHGSDSKIIDTTSMMSRNDPAGQKGKTILALGIAHLKGLSMRRNVGNLQTPDGWDALAGAYNGAGRRSIYSGNITACTKTMLAKKASFY